ncbi:MAG: hypothetical protein CMJ48_11620 [Planctomycetaceae bacterium]|nr:hypothetical protein [Planctomycetaceae bacterium]
MSSHACSEVERQLWRYIDRELPAHELSSISGHLKRCGDCQQLYLDGAGESNGYRTAFVNAPFGEPFVAKFRKRMAAEELLESGALGIGPGRSLAGATVDTMSLEAMTLGAGRGRGLRRLLTVLAMVILIPVVLTVGLFYGRSSLGQFSTEGGKASLVRGGGTYGQELGRGEILAGDRFELTSGVLVSLSVPTRTGDARSWLELVGSAVFVMDDSSDAQHVLGRLESGTLNANVAKDPERREFSVETPHAVIRVLGTRFVLKVEGDRTYLTVTEGEVELRPLGDARTRVVTPETEEVGVNRHGDFVQRPPLPSPVVPAPPVAVEPSETEPISVPEESPEPPEPGSSSIDLDTATDG